MRLVTVRLAGGPGAPGAPTSAGRLEADSIVLLPYPDVGALLAEPGWEDAARADGRVISAGTAELAPVVPRPPKIVCLGLNYASHVREMGRQLPEYPTLFAKYALALTGPRDPIELPGVSGQVDWEVELAFVIGRAGRRVPRAAALDHVAGWTVINDVSMRDYQMRTTQFLSGKTFERSTPLGPALVTRDEVSEDGLGLGVRCVVDGEVMQDSNTSDLIFTPAEIVAYLSEIFTLQPGDVVATGTPDGVAAARQPPPWLRPGQTVTTVVDGVGELCNRFVGEVAATP